MNPTAEHLELSTHLFKDLVQLAQVDPGVFDELFYNRTDECARFEGFLENIYRTADNILITGEAGIGKTNFIHRVVRKTDLLKKSSLHPILIDYRDAVPHNARTCLCTLVEQLQIYFSEVNRPIHTLKANTPELVDENLRAISRHLSTLSKDAPKMHPVVFIDDLDYADEEWHELLSYVYPIAGSSIASVVLTVRPHLLAAIDSWDNRFSFCFTRATKHIELNPLQVEHIISSRLVPILAEQATNPLWSYLKARLSNSGSLAKLLGRISQQQPEALGKFEYPFTAQHNDFIRQITNGNIREIFDIAYESLVYIAQHPDLELRQETYGVRKNIGREGIMQALFDKKDAKYHILNLHQHRSPDGNSLLYNTLEAVRLHRGLSEDFYTDLRGLGHKRNLIDWAVDFLADKSNRLIQPTKYYPERVRRKLSLFDEYKITDKGEYFIQMADWYEYQKRCGMFGRSLSERLRGV